MIRAHAFGNPNCDKTHIPSELRKRVTWFDIKHTNVVYGTSCNVGTRRMPAETQDSTWEDAQQKRMWHTHKYTTKGNWVLLPQRPIRLAFYNLSSHLVHSCEELFYSRRGTTVPWNAQWYIWYLFYFIFLQCPRHMEVPRPGTEPEPQL